MVSTLTEICSSLSWPFFYFDLCSLFDSIFFSMPAFKEEIKSYLSLFQVRHSAVFFLCTFFLVITFFLSTVYIPLNYLLLL